MMAHVRRLLVALLAALGLLSALGLSSASLAVPVAAPMMTPAAHMDGCGHSPMPNAPASHDDQNCATMCCAVLPPLATMARESVLPLAPAVARLDPLSGIDPGLDPPPPRMS